MGQELILKLKEVKQALVDLDLKGEEWEERQEILQKLEDVTSYVKDAMGSENYKAERMKDDAAKDQGTGI